MSQKEIFGKRDLTYSAWHRATSLGRFVGIELAQTLHLIDADASLWVEFDKGSKEPLALIETAIDIGQDHKTATVTRNLARRCVPLLPAFTVLYTPSNAPNPACDGAQRDISAFRVNRIHPNPTGWREFTPSDYANFLVRLRQRSAKQLDQWIGWPLEGGDSGLFDFNQTVGRSRQVLLQAIRDWRATEPSKSDFDHEVEATLSAIRQVAVL